MFESKPVVTPLDLGTRLIRNEPITDEDEIFFFRELIRALTYLAVSTRPDIAYAVSHLGQFNNCYASDHWQAAKRVLRYLKATKDTGLSGRTTNPIIGYMDALLRG